MGYYTAIRKDHRTLTAIGMSSTLKTAISTLRHKMPKADEEGFIFRAKPRPNMSNKEINAIAVGRMYLEEAESNNRFFMCCMYEDLKTGKFYYVYANGKMERM